jgi:hypothetical protein
VKPKPIRPNPAVVTVSWRRFQEETFFSASVTVSDVLEWSQRHGKDLTWNYL